MPSYFQSNLAIHLDTLLREQLADLIGARPGDWAITLMDRPEVSAWDVSIDGPNGFEWGKRFEDIERQIDAVVRSIRTAIDLPSVDLATALANLAKAGIAFTTETEADGKTVYIIDRIRLCEDELIHLKNTGALTPNAFGNTSSIALPKPTYPQNFLSRWTVWGTSLYLLEGPLQNELE